MVPAPSVHISEEQSHTGKAVSVSVSPKESPGSSSPRRPKEASSGLQPSPAGSPGNGVGSWSMSAELPGKVRMCMRLYDCVYVCVRMCVSGCVHECTCA